MTEYRETRSGDPIKPGGRVTIRFIVPPEVSGALATGTHYIALEGVDA